MMLDNKLEKEKEINFTFIPKVNITRNEMSNRHWENNYIATENVLFKFPENYI